jgi:Ca2+-binding RTX toxin-like protein
MATIIGTAGDDALAGTAGDDVIIGLSGADIINGADGNDDVYGGDGDDSLYGGAGADILIGENGFDLARYDSALAGVTASLAADLAGTGDALGDTFDHVEGLVGSNFGDVLRGDGVANTLYGLDGADVLSGLGGNDRLLGGLGTDTLNGGDGDDILLGEDDADILNGGAGDDHLYGGLGADALDGGDGFDYARYDYATSGVTLDLAAGTGSGGEAAGDTFANIEGAMGSQFADTLTVSASGSTLFGLGGDDVMIAGPGHDYFDGGAGFDTVHYDAASSRVTIYLGNSSSPQVMDFFNDIESVTGSAFNDILVGRGGITNVLYGRDGNDDIDGSNGDDQLYGENGNDGLAGSSGNDHLYGGDGNDGLYGYDGDDHLYGGAGGDFFSGGKGFDFAHYEDSGAISIDWSRAGDGPGGDRFIDMEGVVGSIFGDTIIANYGVNSLYGAEGNDTLNGMEADDSLYGNDGADTLYGGTGADFIDGGAGKDLLYGEAGADRFVFTSLETTDAGADQILDFNPVGSDLIDLTAIDADTGTGGDQAFTLVGSFTGVAGQAVLTYDSGQNITHMGFDTNGDATADLFLLLSGQVTNGQGFLF